MHIDAHFPCDGGLYTVFMGLQTWSVLPKEVFTTCGKSLKLLIGTVDIPVTLRAPRLRVEHLSALDSGTPHNVMVVYVMSHLWEAEGHSLSFNKRRS